MKRIFTSLVLLFAIYFNGSAQLLPANQCESQTPCNARPICGAPVVTPYSFVTSALPAPVGVCGAFLYGAAGNWVYYRFTCYSSGIFNFRLASNDSATVNSDLDFALWDITTAGCGGINTTLVPLACNAAGNGATGIQTGGLPAANFAPNLNIVAGSTYIIGVSNPNGANTQGHTLTFGGTASITDNKRPYMVNIIPFDPCSPVSEIKIKMSEPVRCSQLGGAPDFTITGTTPAYTVSGGVSCPGCANAAPNSAPHYGNASDTIVLTFATALAPGNYTITPIVNAFRDLCSNADSVQATLSFNVPAPFKDSVRTGFDCVALKYIDTVYALNGTSPYQFKAIGGGLPASAGIYTSVPSGVNFKVYSVSGGSLVTYTIRDTLGCEQDTTINRPSVLALGAPNLSLSASPPCNNQFALDSIYVSSISGGVGPYTFSIAPTPGTGGVVSMTALPTPANPNKWKNIVFTPAGVVFTVTATDALGCTRTGVRNLVNPPLVSWSAISTTNPTCNGDSSGKICFNGASGGTPCSPPNLYSYSILPSFSNTTFTAGPPNCFNNLASGLYTVQATDCNGCTRTTSVLLNQPPALLINTTAAALFTQPTCPLPNSGSYQPTATGGTGSKKYYLLPFDPSAIPPGYADSVVPAIPLINKFFNLSAGVYTVLAKDALGCTATATFTMSLPPLPNIVNVTVNPVPCFGGVGSIVVNTALTAPPAVSLTYSFLPPTPGMTAASSGVGGIIGTFSNVPAGTYTLIVTNSNGCKDTVTGVDMTQPTAPVGFASVVADSVLCFGTSTGQITAQANGGTVSANSYQYSIKIGAAPFTAFSAPTLAPFTFTNLAAGTYTIRTRDHNLCLKDSVVSVFQPSKINLLVDDIDATCFGTSDGEICVVDTGGTAGYQYKLGVAGVYSPSQPAGLPYCFNGLAAGTYTLFTIDAKGCLDTVTATVNPIALPIVDFTAAPNDTVCIGDAVTLFGTGATSYTWAGAPLIVNGVPFIPLAGTTQYTVTGTDAGTGCSNTAIAFVRADTLPIVQPIVNQVVCNNTATSVVNFVSSAGSTFAWSHNGTGIGLVNSGSGNIGSFTAINTTNLPVVVTFTVTPTGPGITACVGADITFTITINPDAFINLISPAGTDAQVVCINTPIDPIQYQATGGGTGYTFAGLPPGVTGDITTGLITGTPSVVGFYTYTVTTTGTCAQTSITGTIDVTPNATVSLSSPVGTNSQTVCINSCIANIDYTIGGTGTGGTVTGLPAGATFNVVGNILTISGCPSVAGLFTYTVTATGNCASATITGTINVSPLQDPSFTYLTGGTYCQTGTDPFATITGIPGGTFSAIPNTLVINSSTGLIDLSASPLGIYTIQYVTPGPCPDSTTFSLNITLAPSATFNYAQVAYCQNDINPFPVFAPLASGGAFTASSGSLIIDINSGEIDLANSAPGTYTVTNTIAPAGGCAAAVATTVVTVNPNATISLSSAAGTDAQVVCINTPLTNITYSIGGGGTGAGAIGLPPGVSGNYVGSVFTISGSPTAAGFYTYTVTTTGTCGQTSIVGTIDVTPDATITFISTIGSDQQTVCVNTPIDLIQYQFGASGTGFTYAGLPPGVTGDPVTGNITGTPTVVGLYTYTVTTTGPCAQASTFGFIDVVPDATLSLSSAIGTNNQTVCINSCITNIDYTIGGTGTGGFVTGLPTGLTASVTGNILTVTGCPSVSGVFSYTVTATGTCGSTTTTGAITVTPLQDASFTYLTGSTYCQTGTDPIATITGISGGTFSAIPNTLVINSATGLIDLSASPLGSYTVQYVTPGPCPDSTTFVIICTTAPCATFSYANSVYCQNDINPFPIFSGGCSAGSFSGSSPLLIIDPTTGEINLAGSAAGTYTVTNSIVAAGGCAAAIATTVVTIDPNATIALSSVAGTDAQTLCINTSITNITYAIAGGGTGASVVGLPAGVTGNFGGGVFTISGTPTAVGSYVYTVTTTGTCGQTSATGTIDVTPDATLVLTSAVGTDAQIVCVNTPITNIVYLTGGGGTGYSFAGLPFGVTGNSVTGVISGTPSVVGTSTYTVTSTGTCIQTSLTGTIDVTPDATLTLSSVPGTDAQVVCEGSAIIPISYTIGGTGTGGYVIGLPASVTHNVVGTTISITGTLSVPVIAPIVYNYTVVATGTCDSAIAVGSITIDTLLNPQFNYASATICNIGSVGPTLVVNPGGVFSVSPPLGAANFNTSTGTFTFPIATGGYTIKYVTPGVCKDSNTLIVTITDAPCAQFSYTNTTYCQSAINPTPIFPAGCSAGGFSYTPAVVGNVLSINASTGVINLASSDPGTYTIANDILASGSCPAATYTVSVTIVSKPNPTLGTINPAGCNPTCNGSVQVTTTGGSPIPGPGYTYVIAGFGTPTINAAGLASAMCAGNVYTVTATDAIGCTGTVTINMIQSPAVVLNTTAGSVTAPGACDGIITAVGSAGTAPYVYSIAAALPQLPPGQFNNACDTTLAGSNAPCYTVTVTDFKGCTATNIACVGTMEFTITAQTNILCNGGNNGSFAGVVTGGAGPYGFSIAPAAAGITQTSATTAQSSNLTAGSYTVTVQDANAVTVSRVVTITQPNVLSFATPVINTPSCSPGCDGTMTIVANGGTNPKTYAITSPVGSTCVVTQPSNGTFNGLGVGNYTVTTTDFNGCIHDTIITINLSPLPTLSLSATDPSCNNICDGTITCVGGLGTPVYSYAINVPAGSTCVPQQITSGNFSNLGGGTYTVVITDSKLCNTSATITLVNPQPIVLDPPVITNPLCNGNCNGTVTLTSTGGTPGPGSPTFTLSSGISQSNTSGVFNSLCANTYTASVSDATGCSASTTLVITNPTSIVWTVDTFTNITCNGANNGTITVSASGGTGVKTYSRDGVNFFVSGSFTNLLPGLYVITAKDINGCTITTSHTITEPPVLLLSIPLVNPVLCNNGSDGSISISASGGTPGYVYNIIPAVQPSNTTGNFVNLPAGTYAINVTDTTGCTKVQGGIVVIEPPALVYTLVNHQDVFCYGEATGTITVGTQGGTPVVTYAILPNIGVQSPSGFFSGLVAGTYIVTGTDVNSCSVSTSVTITEGPRIVLNNITMREPICNGDANGSISFTVTGGTGTLSYQLNGGTFQTDTVFYNLVAGNYILTVKDVLGCTTNSNIIVTEPAPVGAILNLTGANCVDSKDGKAVIIGTGGRGGYLYYITPGLHINNSGIFYGLEVGAYVLRVVDTAGCEYTTNFVINPPPFPLTSTITKQDLACNGVGNEGSATAIPSGGTPPYTYEWNTKPVQTTAKASTLYFGYYDVKITDAYGCEIRDSVYIEEGPCCDVAFIPNAFSPNGDFNNDVFRVLTTAGVELIQLEIYNRWGKRVWSTIDYRRGWDGTIEGSAAPVDTYHYIYRYKCTRDGVTYTKKGDVILIR